MNFAGQVLNIGETVVRCNQLSRNFRIRGNTVERNFQEDDNEFNKLRLKNETADSVVIEKDSLIAYGIPASEVIITTNDHDCGLKHCSNILKQKEDSPQESKHKLNHEFIKEITDRISENLREESDRDIELWTEELKITLNRMRDEGLVSRQEKTRLWEE